VVLYTCGQRKVAGRLGHPCGRAARALDEAGFEYEVKVVGGYRLAAWTWGRRGVDRAEVKELSGTNEVPILVLDDGEVISGSSVISRWAKEHPRERAAAGRPAD
jgi:glutathione S-transferase